MPCQMPAFGATLSDEDIVAVIENMRSWWGSEDRAFGKRLTANDPFPRAVLDDEPGQR